MNLDLHGRRAVVCGSTRGIGLASARELALLGATCVLVARDQAALEQTARELPSPRGQRHETLPLDFDDIESVRGAAKALASGEAHPVILVNNTGGPPGGRAIDADVEEYIRAFRQHVLASQTLAQALMPGMKQAGYGRIINIISTSVKAPIAGLGVSNTIRGAMASWAKTLAAELAPMGITVNNVLPGFTDTDRLRSLIATRASKSGTSEQAVEQEMRASVPTGRFGTAEEIAAAVAFLASPAAAYVNGINLPVDGGRTPTL
jgi:3-oxoacyl-[acyl-carrier protein] reductase